MKKLVVLTGAGISAESGLRTFRDSDGLWENYRVEDVATPEAWKRDPELVLRFYDQRRRDVGNAQPNAAHIGLAGLQEQYRVQIITQNIDDLHERAGSKHVLHLHGAIFKMRSEDDPDLLFDIRGDMYGNHKTAEGGILRPHVVWFGEQVPLIEPAAEMVAAADIFVIIGTSLAVYPASNLLHYAPSHIPKYILDKKIPTVSAARSLIRIEEPPAKGMEKLIRMLAASGT